MLGISKRTHQHQHQRLSQKQQHQNLRQRQRNVTSMIFYCNFQLKNTLYAKK